MSIPGAFSPVEIDGRLLVDGGIALNLPMDVAREMGADVLIVVDLTIPYKKKEDLNSALEILEQSSDFLTSRNVQRQLATLTDSDVRIHPIMGDITTMDFKRGAEAITIGEKAAREMAEELTKYIMSEEEYENYLSERKVLSSEAPVIDFIRVTTDSKVSGKVIEAKLKISVGEPLDDRKLNDNLNIIYGLGYYDAITYDLVTEDGRTGLVIDARSRSWGPGYFRFGLNLKGNINGVNGYKVGFRYTRTEINSLAGEWRTDLELGDQFLFSTGLHLPLEKSLKLFVSPSLEVNKKNIDSFDADGERIAEHRVTDSYATLAGGSEISNWGEFRLGVRRGAGDSDLLVGTVPPVVDDFERGDAFFKLSLDTLDDIHFPHHGSWGTANVVLSREGLGADDSYERFFIDWLGATTWGRGTVVTGLEFGSTRDEDAPFYDQFTLGGFLNLSGYGSDELRGQNYGLIQLAYYHRVWGSLTSILEGVPVYTGISLEAGNVWDDLDNADIESVLVAGSVFLGADTPIGPLYLAAGYGEGGRTSLYFYLGRTF
jgi:NTE family protein